MTLQDIPSSPVLKNKASRRFRPSATESFVIVKPPPTVSTHHPLNLQIQYIPAAGVEQPRRRRTSSSSEKSGSESSSGNSTTRNNGRIVPLYNLHTHSHGLLANSICDAGTDEKIAKFHKQGVEVVNVGLFAPVEAWSSSSLDPEDVPSATRDRDFMDIPALTAEPPSIEHPSPSRRLFGKLFHSKQQPQYPNSDLSVTPLPSDYHPEYALPPILGTAPTLLSRTLPPVGRATSYTWLCKRWCKEGDESWLSQALHPIQDKCGVDIRIEWARGNRKDRDGPSRQSSLGNLQAEADGDLPPVPSLPSLISEEARGRSSVSLPVPSTPLFGRRKGSNGSGSACRMSDVEDDSDPEDSEVPWICTFVIRAGKSRPSSPVAGLKATADNPLRIKVASLAPAPHHPKVVAQFKVQYPLPDVDLLDAVLIQRQGLPGAVESQPAGKHILTAEDIKDIVCSTSLWVVVREGFSGLSKKQKRQGS
ncbi:hypothetical protein FRB91_007985 [Serendipita sp. 411]|nr:hypothetical protein FRB91_007985 [Serendipita sp. 411]